MRRLAAALAVLLLLAGACGSDDRESDGSAEADNGDAASSLELVTVDGEFGSPPVVSVPAPFSVSQTASDVLIEGDGDQLVTGMTVKFDYVAVNGRTGEAFDSSYETRSVSAVLEEDQILLGLVKGLVGRTVGSRVLIALAPGDAFGTAGAPELDVRENDTLVFVIDVHDGRVPLERADGTPVEPVAGLPHVTLDDTGKPTVTVPEDTDPPSEFVAQVLIQGNGDTVAAGQNIVVHYTGVIWVSGEQFDSSWDRDAPTTFPIGMDRVIDGWDNGLVGQQVGSQLLLVVPPDQGYGAEGYEEAGIAGTDTLVFVVDILDAYD